MANTISTKQRESDTYLFRNYPARLLAVLDTVEVSGDAIACMDEATRIFESPKKYIRARARELN